MTDLDSQPFAVQVTPPTEAEEVRVQLSGELDLAVADDVRAALDAAIRCARERVLVDISRVTFMDSTGLATLVHARDAARDQGRRLFLTQPRAQVRRLFQITGMLDGFSLLDGDGR
jgi:anti-sigma B factor antagonist/stage II sporulation protein AA (anti-sigma F factor antagonist)